MNKVRRYQALAAVLVLLSARLCFGWADNWSELRTAANRITSISAKFVQEKHMKMLVRPLVSTGLLYFQGPDSLRWEYLHPVQTILITHQGDTKKYIRKDGRIFEDAASGSQAMQFVVDEIKRWLKGRFDENNAFEARLEPGPVIVLTPRYKSLGAMIQRIVLTLSDQPGVMDSVLIYEAEDSYTRLKFTDVQLNRQLPAGLFEALQ